MRKFEIVADKFLQYGEKEVKFPYRATKNSAGYDFFSPIDIVIPPTKIQLIWTNIKAQFNQDEVLMLFVTSKIGKNGVMMANGTGIIEYSLSYEEKAEKETADQVSFRYTASPDSLQVVHIAKLWAKMGKPQVGKLDMYESDVVFNLVLDK